MSNRRNWHRLATLAAAVAFAACSDVLSLDVEAPGRIADEDLNTPQAVPGIVAGMSFDLTDAMDATLQDVVLAGGEIGHGGSYDFGAIPGGKFMTDDEDWAEYSTVSQARWVAEAGLRRVGEILGPAAFEKNADVARAYLLGGFANRMLGELQCRVTFDEGPDVPHTDAFARADSLFSRAILVGTAAGKADVVNAAYGGRASVRAWQGRWSDAAADAAKVPTSFVYNAIFSVANQNDLWYETNTRREFSLYGTMWVDVTDDPRVRWDIPKDSKGQVLRGQDGQTPFYHQLKFKGPEDDVPLTHGAEMRVLQAEAALRNGDYDLAEGFLNQARGKWGMAPLTLSRTPAEAWATLRFERYATLWLEGRRLWDMRRWKQDGAPMADPWLGSRDTCFPIGRAESQANPNVSAQWGGCPTCG